MSIINRNFATFYYDFCQVPAAKSTTFTNISIRSKIFKKMFFTE